VRDKSVPVVKNETSVSKDHKRWPSDQRRKVSIGGVHSISPSPTSQSPSASAHPSAPMAIKRRSTMNSRDAAYEEQVQAALEASKREAMFVNGHEESDAGDEGSQQPIEDEEEMELEQAQARNGKRERDDGRSGERCPRWKAMSLIMSRIG